MTRVFRAVRLTVACHVGLGLALVIAPRPGLAQDGASDTQRLVAGRMLGVLQDALDRFYFDSTFHGLDVDGFAAQAQRTIDTATSIPVMLGALAQFMQGLRDSHTRFIPPMITTEVDYGVDWQVVGDDCFVRSVRRGSDAAKRGIQRGDRITSIDGLRPTRGNLRLISYVYHLLSPREGLHLQVQHPDGATETLDVAAKVTHHPQYLSAENLEHMRYLRDFLSTTDRVEHLFVTRDSVAIWQFTGFEYKDGRIDKYMNEARKYPWLIVDLRGNGGGAVEGITRLLGHFVDAPVAAFQQRWRDSTVRHQVEPRGKGGAYHGQVIVLTDASTASASEVTSRILQQDFGATVVGDRSMGAVVASITLPLAVEASGTTTLFGATVSVFDIILNDGTRLENAGVIPNVAALPTGRDLASGADPVLQFALELAGVKVTAAEAATLLK